jgi:hypothetical protein
MIRRYVRRICRGSGNALILNLPKDIYAALEKDIDQVQYVIFQDEIGNKFVALCGLDGFGKLTDILNKE